MKNLRLVLVGISLVLVTACIQEAKWTWTGDTPGGDVAGDGVTGDGKGEISPSDVPGSEDIDVAAPKDTTDTIEPKDTDTIQKDICVPDCDGKTCGDDGCGGSCGTCDDVDPCNGEEACEEGLCIEGSTLDCDDDNPCTTDSCVEGEGCEHTPVPDKAEPACGDGNPCTDDVCVSGECKNPLKDLQELVIEDCLCEGDEDCEPLEDGDLCNGTLVCDTEADTPTCMVDEETIVTCSLPDGTAPECNAALCVPGSGECAVGTINEGGACDDGDACTQGEQCHDGECKNGGPVSCEDSNGCTDDSCDSATGCTHVNNMLGCDDLDDCTHSDVCLEGVCQGTEYSCDDPAQCETTDGATCNGDGTCIYDFVPMNGVACDDGNACTQLEACQGGICMDGGPVSCDDGNPCTADLCEDPGGCVHPSQAGDCDDNDPCTVGDHCDGGACVSGTALLVCDDDNVCTDNVCTSMVGCEYPLEDDETPCGEGFHCIGGDCVAVCTPDCSDKDCGDDGCGGLCGYCPSGEICVAGTCDTSVDEDLDHDGVCPLDTCDIVAVDTCPTVWNPDNEAAICPGLYVAPVLSRSVLLGENVPGVGSSWRRTHEPVEIPLRAGFLDATVVGDYPLAGDGQDHSDLHNDLVLPPDPGFGAGPFGAADGALSLDGQECAVIPEIPEHELAAGTLMLWFKLDIPHGPGAPPRTLVDKQGSEGAYALTLLLDTDGRITFGVYPSTGIESETATWDTGWHHVAATWGSGGDMLMVDGVVEASTTWPSGGLSVTGDDFTVGCVDVLQPGLGFPGDIADLVLLSRTLSPAEVAGYVAAGARWGTNLLPGGQADWDDLRVSETTDLGDGEHFVPFEVLGPRPHSDTPCPSMYQDTPTADITEIRHRDDLCGVLGYWRLDGDGFSVPPSPSLVASPVSSFQAIRGRFGDLPGAFAAGAPDEGLETPGGASALDVGASDLTVELWLRVAGPSNWVVPILQKKHTDAPVKGFAVVYSHTNGQVSCEFFSSGTEVVSSKVRVDDGAWRHVACVLDRGAGATGLLLVYVDGMETGRTELDAAFGSLDNQEPLEFFSATQPAATFDMELDEVLIHDVARSPEYLRRRAQPGTPTVRFLASTSAVDDGGLWPWYDYAIHRGGGSPGLSRPFVKSKDGEVCWGLLSSCMGYRGWWRFDEGGGSRALDSSVHCNHGEVKDGAWGPGRAGSALQFNGVSTYVQVPHHESLSIWQKFVMEVSVHIDASTDNQRAGLILKGWLHEPDSNGDVVNYELFKRANDHVRSFYEHANGNEDYKDANIAVTFGIWQRYLAQWTFGKHQVFLEDESAGYIVSGVGPGTNSRDLWFGVENAACGPPGPAPECVSNFLHGWMDSARIMDRILAPDEFLHYPTSWALGDLTP